MKKSKKKEDEEGTLSILKKSFLLIQSFWGKTENHFSAAALTIIRVTI